MEIKLRIEHLGNEKRLVRNKVRYGLLDSFRTKQKKKHECTFITSGLFECPLNLGNVTTCN